ncbi:hypothetical protein OOT00_12590 [Desulfobotulus sp. H1]|uniref:Uncharacterized protein n=1 Tax=Desulfobotulus pelophilus TaxID=2823377 RepID=A0ABT3NBH8_9BACT|nr:hypothetical protein [Desulfobotulus pelophilus]MCW7754821.1 hypothetical protein [Desulfobotulus pelophilus]
MVMSSIDRFVAGWTADVAGIRPVFEAFLRFLREQEGVELDFNERPGVSFSLRAKHENQKNRRLFAMVDIIDDDPENRWLSVCFYGDMVTDPDEVGDLVPGGLLGEDGYCFDLEEAEAAPYLRARLAEACAEAAKG